MLNNWQRIEQVIKWAGAASVSAFAREIGLNRGENLYQIKRGNNGISRELAETITRKYHQVSKAWLLTGEGDMLPGTGITGRCEIPFYKLDMSEIVKLGDAMPDPEYYISVPMYRDCELASYNFSDAMLPSIPQGAVLFLKKCTPSALVPGAVYFIHSPSFTGLRVIRRDAESDRLRLTADNKERYDDVFLAVGNILELYQVKGVIINK